MNDIHDTVLMVSGGRPGVHVASDIHRAIERPMTYASYRDEYDIDTVCALLIDSIARYHGFNDGNKRTALMTAILTYRINEIHFKATDSMNEEFDALVMWVVNHKPEVEEIEERLKSLRKTHEIGGEQSIATLFNSFVSMLVKKQNH